MRRELGTRLPSAISTTAAMPLNSTVDFRRAVPAQQMDANGVAQLQKGKTITIARLANVTQDTALQQLMIVSLIALAVFAVLSVVLAWWMAGRVLRPVHTITATARKLSGENLSERIDLKAPPGELKDLADTFDGMLDRLESLVSAQQRFVANAAHELRTPLAVQRAALEIGLADPSPERVARVRSKLLNVADRSERLIEGLLLLSTSDQGLDRTELVELDEVVERVASEHEPEADARDITIDTRTEPVRVDGDPVLLGHLVRNLLENALRYNVPGGRIDVRLDRAGLTVSNTGTEVPDEVVPHLFEPFRRLNARRHKRGEGTGLGLSIVTSIAHAHGWEATAAANPGGGLTVSVAPRPRSLTKEPRGGVGWEKVTLDGRAAEQEPALAR
ncbi:HAMP domain-containing protein [Actinomadura barringtoniae]|uniref:histidine kinase n=2 Tax=Actinomadura barringtoniae TaxID=1427535 RepID=A0A939P5V1_9ACTN|nr:HAMP domain-containing protein [Actinomadura barringtoniae]